MSDFDRLAAELEANPEPIIVAVVPRFSERVEPWLVGSAAAREQMIEVGRIGLMAELRAFCEGAIPARCPDFLEEALRRFAGVSNLDVLLTAYRVMQVCIGDAWRDLVEAQEGIEAKRRHELIDHGADFLFRYTDAVSKFIAETYQRELVKGLDGGETRRYHAIRRLLDGKPVGAPLEVDLDLHHIGIVSWGEDPAGAVRELAAALQRPALIVQPLDASCWAWLSAAHPLEREERRRLADFVPASATRLALGLEVDGEAGFRASNRQALRAQRLAPAVGRSLVRYEDVAVQALAAENEEDASAFVALELAGLDEDSGEAERLRETLAAYFAADLNAASAAARLGVHHRTVLSRLRSIEERLERPIGSARLELEVALRLRSYFAMVANEFQ